MVIQGIGFWNNSTRSMSDEGQSAEQRLCSVQKLLLLQESRCVDAPLLQESPELFDRPALDLVSAQQGSVSLLYRLDSRKLAI